MRRAKTRTDICARLVRLVGLNCSSSWRALASSPIKRCTKLARCAISSSICKRAPLRERVICKLWPQRRFFVSRNDSSMVMRLSVPSYDALCGQMIEGGRCGEQPRLTRRTCAFLAASSAAALGLRGLCGDAHARHPLPEPADTRCGCCVHSRMRPNQARLRWPSHTVICPLSTRRRLDAPCRDRGFAPRSSNRAQPPV